MKNLMKEVKAFINDEEGASAVEYGPLVAGIAVAIMSAVYFLGTTLTSLFSSAATRIAAGS
jgi:pilus assembly protein Flp/PilA